METSPRSAPPAALEKRYPEANLGIRPERDDLLSADRLLEIGIFQGVAADDGGKRLRETLRKSPGAVVLRRYREGEMVCRQGEPGRTAFYILTAQDLRGLEGGAPAGAPEPEPAPGPAAEVSLVHAGAAEESPGLVARLRRALFGRRKARGHPAYLPNDGPMDLRYERPVAQMSEGDIFGESACMTFTPRSATVRALRDCAMIEMLRSVFEELQKNAKFRAAMDERYRSRAMAGHLENMTLFRGLEGEILGELVNRAKLERRLAGEAIFKQGDPSDAIYVIRLGWVKVVRETDGVERVLAYLSRGEVVGEMGVALGAPRNATCVAYDHPEPEDPGRGRKPDRTYVDLVRVDRDVFEDLRRLSPELEARVDAIIKRRIAREKKEARALNILGPVAELGLLQGQRLMLIDEDRCTRCDACVEACAATHDGRPRLVREGPRFGNLLVPATCRQCLDPVCMIGCPVGSIHKGERGEIEIESWCIGCGKCAENCPYGAIHMHDRRAEEVCRSEGFEVIQKPVVAVVCDQCASLSDPSNPSCVYACPHEAAMRVDALEFFSNPLKVLGTGGDGEDRFASRTDSRGDGDR